VGFVVLSSPQSRSSFTELESPSLGAVAHWVVSKSVSLGCSEHVTPAGRSLEPLTRGEEDGDSKESANRAPDGKSPAIPGLLASSLPDFAPSLVI
jgi:hypothetical protein